MNPAGDDKKHIEGHSTDRKYEEPVKTEAYDAGYRGKDSDGERADKKEES